MKTSYWQVFKSVAASLFGVQSHKNYQSDFQQPSFMPFLIIGVVAVAGLVLLLVALVNFLT